MKFIKLSWLLIVIAFSFKNLPVLAEALDKIVIDQNTIAQPIIVEGTSEGKTAVQEIARTANTATGYCNGYAHSKPNHSLKLNSFFEYLRLEVESSADTTILVRGPGGIWCNDDAGSTNPIIEGQWQPGLYEIWVGSYQADSNNQYQIKITGK